MAEDYANDSLDHSNTLHEMWHVQLPAFNTLAPIGTVGYLRYKRRFPRGQVYASSIRRTSQRQGPLL